MWINYKTIHPDAKVPYRKPEDLAYDFYCVPDETFRPPLFNGGGIRRPLAPGERHLFHTGICLHLPENYGMLLWDRSGLGSKGIHVLAGCIDPSYRGEIMICLINLSSQDHEIFPGDRIAQGFLQQAYTIRFNKVEELPESDRGEKGFGSSGA